MKKIIITTIILLVMAVMMPYRAQATTVSQPSATLAKVEAKTSNLNDVRVQALKNVFIRHNSPLVDVAQAYVKYADQFGVDWKLLPSISGLESSFGLHLMPGSYNAYGWGGGHIYFNSWEDGIATINKALKKNYIDRGATDVWSIGPIYAESPTWSVRVNNFMNEINEEYLKLSTFTLAPTI